MSAPVPVPFLWTLDLGHGFLTWIWDWNWAWKLFHDLCLLFCFYPEEMISELTPSALHPWCCGLIITGIFLSPSPKRCFYSHAVVLGNDSLTRDIMLDTSQRLDQLSRKRDLNWCSTVSCFSHKANMELEKCIAGNKTGINRTLHPIMSRLKSILAERVGEENGWDVHIIKMYAFVGSSM